MIRVLRELILSVLMALVLFLVMNTLTARSYVDGPSMEPNLHTGEVLLVSRLGISGLTREVYAAAHNEESTAIGGWVPPRGSIVTFVEPNDPSKTLIKRVIGLPGEAIQIDNGVVKINGNVLDEPYVQFHDKRSMSPRVVPPDALFMMGDNRPASNDSRIFGPVPRSNLRGMAVLRYWPLREFELLVGR